MNDIIFNFGLVLSEIDRDLHEIEDALYEAGCNDALLTLRGSIPVLEFDREDASLETAVISALGDVASAAIDAVVLRIEPDDLVSSAEIARRADVSREAVRLWTTGKRRAKFPLSRARVGKSDVWSWREVARWLCEYGEIPAETVAEADVIAGLNLALELHRSRATPTVWRSSEELLGHPELLEAATGHTVVTPMPSRGRLRPENQAPSRRRKT